jgi:hypothetical protein
VTNFPALLPLAMAIGYGVQAANRRVARSKARKATPPQPVALDVTLGDPELRRLREAAGRGDWPAMAAILEPVRARGDFDRLTWLINGIETVAEGWLFPLADKYPDDALVRTVVGARTVAWAWEARSGARADQVTQEQFKLFHERLTRAEDHLFAAVELDPTSAAPWYPLLLASRGLEHGADVSRRRFEAGTARAPFDVGMHSQLLQQLCAKWGGSHEETHAFARESMLTAPQGSAMGLLVATAHLEHWLDLPRGEDTAYMRDPAVLASLREAAGRSVDHPAFGPTSTPYTALNAFAMAFWLAGDRPTAHRLFERIGDNVTQSPWQYMGKPGAVYAVARTECENAHKNERKKRK